MRRSAVCLGGGGCNLLRAVLMLREEAASIAGHLITRVLLIVNADQRQISPAPLLLKLLFLSLQKCYMKMIRSNSIRDG